jgi:cyanophycinase
MYFRRFIAVVAVIFVTACASNRTTVPFQSTSANSARGSLVIVGGGPSSPDVQRKFMELAGGAGKANIAIFPMASELAETGESSAEGWRKLGARAWVMNITREQALAAGTASSLDSATGIWFPGGDQVRITNVLVGTPTAAAIRARFLAGAVVGGTSAGAAVMSTPMLTGDERHPGGARPDTTQNWITIARDNVVVIPALGLAEGAIVDQHFLRRRRHNRLVSVVLEHPRLIGVGIDESTALVIEPGAKWSILGASAAVVYDARESRVTPMGAGTLGATDVRMHVLPSGSRFDPLTGTATLP